MKIFHTFFLIVFLAGSIAVPVSMGTATGPDISPAEKFCQLERDIPSLYLINGLNLSPEQASKAALLTDQVLKIETKCNEQYERLLKTHQQIIEREANDILLSAGRKGGQIDSLKNGASPQAKKLKETLDDMNKEKWESQKKVNALARECYDILTDSQKKIMSNFIPCFIPANDFKNPERVGQAAADTSFVEKELTDLRNTPDGKKKEAQEAALFRIVRQVMHKKYIPYNEENEASVRTDISAKLQNAVSKITSMKDAEFELEKKKLAADIFTLKIDNSPNVLCWKISRYILNPGVADVLKARAAGAAARKGSSTAKTAGQDKKKGDYCAPDFGDPTKPIRTTTLIKGLELTSDQAEKLLPIVKDAVSARQKVEDDMKQTMTEALDKYDALRKELAEGRPSSGAEGKAGSYHSKVRNMRLETLVKELLKYESELDQLLTAKQVEFLSAEKKDDDCAKPRSLIVRKDAGNEEIDKNLGRAKKIISEVRRMASPAFQKEGENMCRKFISDVIAESNMKPDEINVESEVTRAMELLDKARKLDNAKYSSQRNDLAAELCPKRSKPRDATYGHVDYKGDPERVLNSSTQMLFTEISCDAIEKLASRKSK